MVEPEAVLGRDEEREIVRWRKREIGGAERFREMEREGSRDGEIEREVESCRD